MCDRHPKALYFQNCFVDGSYLHILKNRHVNLESWRNDGLAGTSWAFTSLKESNTGLLPASSNCPLSFLRAWMAGAFQETGWAVYWWSQQPPSPNSCTDWSVSRLHERLKTTPDAGTQPCSDEHTLVLLWFPPLMAGHTSNRTADPEGQPQPVAQTALTGHCYLLC